MHILVPPFILHKAANNEHNGRFPATGLFVDIAGFTQVTEALLGHGQHGAEVLATVMRAIFEPLIKAVYAQSGFVSNFAGDAFTAIFPTEHGSVTTTALRGLSAATAIQTTMQNNAIQTTPYGDFTFSAKVGLAGGTAVWGIIHSPDQTRAAYYFRGSAVTGCTDAEHDAEAGDIVVNTAVYQAAKSVGATAAATNTHWRITNFTTDQLPASPPPATLLPYNLDLAARFFPHALLQQDIDGEFRHIHYLFISLKGRPHHGAITEFVRVLFELQQTYGGLLNRIDFGDKGCHMLLFWGAPTSHESDLARILSLILKLRQRSTLPLRAGVTYRIAHAGFVGSALAEEYTCYGRGVNLAARHMMAADWGEIWLDGEMARRAEQQFNLSFMDERAFKGFAEPQPVYLLNGRRENVSTAPYSGVLVGREAELEQLHNWLTPWRNGHNPGALLLSGEAGIGKSRLVYEFIQNVQATIRCRFFVCQTDEILRQSLNPFRYFLRDFFQQSAQQTVDANRKTFDHILHELTAATDAAALKADLVRGRSFLAHLVDLHWENSLFAQLEPQLRFENTLYALKTFFLAASSQQPIILHVEDTHWLDEDSRQFLNILTHEIDAYPLALLATGRTAVTEALFAPQYPLQEIHLQTLGTDAIDALAYNLLGHDPGNELARFLAERTDGNPFFVEQMLLYLQEEGLLEQIEAGQQAQFADTLPTDARALLVARLDRLTLEVRTVVQQASVLGREFEINILEAVTDTTLDLSTQLQTGTEDAIWFPLSDQRYIFKHALLRDAAYKMQVRSRRRILHEKTAVAYETIYKTDTSAHYGQIAYHYDEAAVTVKALNYYERAAMQAKSNYHNEETLTFFGHALRLAAQDNTELRYRLLMEREEVYGWLGSRTEQAQDLAQLDQLLETQTDNHKHANLALRHSAYALVMGQYNDAVTIAQNSLAIAQTAHNSPIQAKAYHQWGRTLWQQGKGKEAVPRLEKALNISREQQIPELEALCLYDLGISHYYYTDFLEAEKNVQQAMIVYQKLNDIQGEIRCLDLFGIIEYTKGDFVAANTHYEIAYELCKKIGWRHYEAHNLSHIGNSYFELGAFNKAHEHHEQALTIFQKMGHLEGEAVSLDTLGLISHFQGDIAKALLLFERALDIQNKINNQRSLGYTLTHYGYSLIQKTKYTQSKAAFKQAQKIFEKAGDSSAAIGTFAGLAQVALVENKFEQAVELVLQILKWIELNGVAGIEVLGQVYLICFRVLAYAALQNPHWQSDAQKILQTGYQYLQERAARIHDPILKHQFLNAVSYNRELQEIWSTNHLQNEGFDKLNPR